MNKTILDEYGSEYLYNTLRVFINKRSPIKGLFISFNYNYLTELGSIQKTSSPVSIDLAEYNSYDTTIRIAKDEIKYYPDIEHTSTIIRPLNKYLEDKSTNTCSEYFN